MISKKEFVEIINRLKETYDIKEKVNETIRNSTDCMITDFTEVGSLMICHEDIVVNLLENMFNNTDIISWWIYEMDYGRNFRMGSLTDNGEDIDLTTAEKLYDYLTR